MSLRLVGESVWLSVSLGMGAWTAHTGNRGNVQTNLRHRDARNTER